MPNFPPNYAEQESYYASQEYKDGVDKALESGGKLPSFEDKTGTGKKVTSRKRGNKLPPLSYPVATGPSQRTGDRLVIKCLEFEPPGFGAGANNTNYTAGSGGFEFPVNHWIYGKWDKVELHAGRVLCYIALK